MNAELKQYQVEPESFWDMLMVMGGDGYDDMEQAEKHKWRALSCWGKEGWDVGNWPYVIVFCRNREGKYQVIEYVEGDVTMYSCPTKEVRNAIIDELAFCHWHHQGKDWVKGYDEVSQLPDTLRGPYRREERNS